VTESILFISHVMNSDNRSSTQPYSSLLYTSYSVEFKLMFSNVPYLMKLSVSATTVHSQTALRQLRAQRTNKFLGPACKQSCSNNSDRTTLKFMQQYVWTKTGYAISIFAPPPPETITMRPHGVSYTAIAFNRLVYPMIRLTN
jgi:hypothetical protein